VRTARGVGWLSRTFVASESPICVEDDVSLAPVEAPLELPETGEVPTESLRREVSGSAAAGAARAVEDDVVVVEGVAVVACDA
jgi:hypothetical protein